MSEFSVDNLMNFNAYDLSIFDTNNPSESSSVSLNIYKTNPKDADLEFSSDGHYRSKVKILLNPHDPSTHIMGHTIVHQTGYYIVDSNGGFFVKSRLGESEVIGWKNARECPLYKAFCKLYYTNPINQEYRDWAKKMFDKRESDWVLVQIIEDNNKPELVGKLMFMKLSQKSVKPVLMNKIQPSLDGKIPAEPLLDYLIGPVLNIDVTPGPDDPNAPERKQREISYSLCNFDQNSYEPIIKIDGTQFFTDEELEIIDTYAKARKDMYFAKSATKRTQAQNTYESLISQIKPLYLKAHEYLKENAPNLHNELGFSEYTSEEKERIENWISLVLDMKDPTNPFIASEISEKISENVPETSEETIKKVSIKEFNPFDDDLPL